MSKQELLLRRKNEVMKRLRGLEQEALELHAQGRDPRAAKLALGNLRGLVPKIKDARRELEAAQASLYLAQYT